MPQERMRLSIFPRASFQLGFNSQLINAHPISSNPISSNLIKSKPIQSHPILNDSTISSNPQRLNNAHPTVAPPVLFGHFSSTGPAPYLGKSEWTPTSAIPASPSLSWGRQIFKDGEGGMTSYNSATIWLKAMSSQKEQ